MGNATRDTDIALNFTVDATKLKNISSIPFQVCCHCSKCFSSCWSLNICYECGLNSAVKKKKIIYF